MTAAVILGGGTGSRMALGSNKVLHEVAGTSMLARSAAAFRPFADRLVIVLRPEERPTAAAQLAQAGLGEGSYLWAEPGETRQASVRHALDMLADLPEDTVTLIHDGARCLVDAETIRRAAASVRLCGTGVSAVPAQDTIKQADENENVTATPDRASLRVIQTPQGFTLGLLREAHRKAEEDGFTGTDDASLVERLGHPVRLVAGSRRNIKLTTPEDLTMAEAMLGASNVPRAGFGYDVHRLVPERKLILCGVEIPHTLGLLGHSDADVALHALMDALLGAAALGDIGQLFPDTDPAYEGADSMKLLEAVAAELARHGFAPVNADLTIAAQRPKLMPHIPAMRANIARVLKLPPDCVSVKATTTERLGFEGREEGISAYAVCMVKKTA